MYEKLTAYIAKLYDPKYTESGIDFVTWPAETPTSDSLFEQYRKDATWLYELIGDFVIHEHPEMELNRYGEILEEAGLGEMPIDEIDVSNLDGRTVMAIMTYAKRAEDWGAHEFRDYCQSGAVKRWLERLQEIDNNA